MKENFIKKLILIATLILSNVSSSQTHSLTDANNRIPTYIVAIDEAYPPFTFSSTKETAVGLDIDLLTAIGKVSGFKIKVLPMNWDKWVEILDQNQADIWAGGVAIKPERKAFASFSNHYMYYSTSVFTRNNPEDKEINSNNIGKYKLSAIAGTVDLDLAQFLSKAASGEKVLIVKNNYLGMKAVAQKKADALIGNDAVLRYYAKRFGLDKFRVFSMGEKEDINKQLGFAVKKGRQELVNLINQGLQVIKSNGEFDKIVNKWLGKIDEA